MTLLCSSRREEGGAATIAGSCSRMGRELMQQLKTSRALPVAVLALALAILAATLYLGTIHLRRQVREQLVNHDGQILWAVAQARQLANGATTPWLSRIESPGDQLALTLEISQLQEGVLAVRLFDARGQFVTAFPPSVCESDLAPDALPQLQRRRPVSRYLGATHLNEVFLLPPSANAGSGDTPLLEVNLPLHDPRSDSLQAVAQLILDARPLDLALARLDQHLWTQSLVAFLAGGALLSAALMWAYRRLQKTNALLQERTGRLLRANHELALAAKTTAVGAVTSHLIHGLSNPLANLQDFMARSATNGGVRPDDTAWEQALADTHKMRALVHEVVRVLSEQKDVDHYEITLTELGAILHAKVLELSRKSGVHLEVRTDAQGQISNRDANLVLLILENLVTNALQVTPRDRQVRVRIRQAGDDVVCEVADQGPGFPQNLLPRLFVPCSSTKGGNGLGLAVSHQLTQQMGGTLELKSNGPDGCVFALTLPQAVLTPETASTTAIHPAPPAAATHGSP